MEISELQQLADRRRMLRRIGPALAVGGLAAAILVVFLYVPLQPEASAEAPAAVAVTSVASSTPDAFANTPIAAKAAIVYDLSEKKILFSKNADAQLPRASLTKLLTIYSALSELSPSTDITIPQDVLGMSAPHAFWPGQVFELKNLARLTLTASLNDGAASIAKAAAAQEGVSIHDMLAKTATELGLAQTYAMNGSGLDLNAAISGGYGSPHDIAILAGALVEKAPEIAAATTQASTTAESVTGKSFTVKNTDPTVDSIPHLLLSKTGYTDLADGNLALIFDVGLNHPIAIVVLGSSKEARFTDGQALVAATLAHFAGVSSL